MKVIIKLAVYHPKCIGRSLINTLLSSILGYTQQLTSEGPGEGDHESKIGKILLHLNLGKITNVYLFCFLVTRYRIQSRLHLRYSMFALTVWPIRDVGTNKRSSQTMKISNEGVTGTLAER